MPNQQDPRMVQWEQRFNTAQRMAQEPRRPNETPEQFQSRQRSGQQAMRHLQTTRPGGNAQQPQTSGGWDIGRMIRHGPIGGLYDMLAQTLDGVNERMRDQRN